MTIVSLLYIYIQLALMPRFSSLSSDFTIRCLATN